ncbi:MAG: YeeE/YedE family protein [SAR324 cluster bacterium]|nr:YeeE/YedE family protein [SAR324 cluster bacterium]
MKSNFSALFAGLLFSIGLAISGMTLPARIFGFLDFAGRWDPTLLFVMGGAVVVNFGLFRLSRLRGAPLFHPKFVLPTRSRIDPALVGGAALFGAGWGLGGFCPGPLLVSVSTGAVPVLVLLAGVIAGIYAADGLSAIGRSRLRTSD